MECMNMDHSESKVLDPELEPCQRDGPVLKAAFVLHLPHGPVFTQHMSLISTHRGFDTSQPVARSD